MTCFIFISTTASERELNSDLNNPRYGNRKLWVQLYIFCKLQELQYNLTKQYSYLKCSKSLTPAFAL